MDDPDICPIRLLLKIYHRNTQTSSSSSVVFAATTEPSIHQSKKADHSYHAFRLISSAISQLKPEADKMV